MTHLPTRRPSTVFASVARPPRHQPQQELGVETSEEVGEIGLPSVGAALVTSRLEHRRGRYLIFSSLHRPEHLPLRCSRCYHAMPRASRA